MSSEILRKAAALMRERAYGATSGPYSVGIDPHTGERSVVYSEFVASRYAESDPTVARITQPQRPGDDGEVEWGQTSDADHIAGWSPEVADQVADWLDSEDTHQFGPTEHAINVARAYLGEQP